LLVGVVAGLAEGLEWAGPEQVLIPSMRGDVVADGSGYGLSNLAMHAAEGFIAELLGPELVPASQAVPGFPVGRLMG
jgi:hypothetical protein